MRINKFLAHAGVASRRNSEEMISAGRIMVNGVLAQIGQQVNEEDQVTLDGKPITAPASLLYYQFNKPRFVVSTVSDPEGRKTVLDFVPDSARLYPVGRLDYESEGLMILTNDGDLAYRLTHPKFEVEKVYRVQVKGTPSNRDIAKLEGGVVIEGKKTAPAQIIYISGDEKRSWYKVVIHEGRNRQIRKMFDLIDYPVMRLIRIQFGEYELGDLKPGDCRQFTPTKPV